MLSTLTNWLLGLAGVGGIAGVAALAIIGGPVVPAAAKLAEAIGTPIANAVGTLLGGLIQHTWTGAVDVLQTGQRILFVALCCTITWQVAVRHTWQEVRHGYTLIEKVWTSAPAPRKK